MTTDRFLGDGKPGPDGDTRVRCWFCANYTHNLQVPVRKLVDGSYVTKWIDCRTCRRGLGHDPFILRRCEAFKVISPQYRIKLPPEAFERGWRLKYGTENHMQGTHNKP